MSTQTPAPKTLTPLTAELVKDLEVGDYLITTIDTAHGQPLEGARWVARRVTRIYARGTSVPEAGSRAYACTYTAFGENSEMSWSVTEGDIATQIRRRPRKGLGAEWAFHPASGRWMTIPANERS